MGNMLFCFHYQPQYSVIFGNLKASQQGGSIVFSSRKLSLDHENEVWCPQNMILPSKDCGQPKWLTTFYIVFRAFSVSTKPLWWYYILCIENSKYTHFVFSLCLLMCRISAQLLIFKFLFSWNILASIVITERKCKEELRIKRSVCWCDWLEREVDLSKLIAQKLHSMLTALFLLSTQTDPWNTGRQRSLIFIATDPGR